MHKKEDKKGTGIRFVIYARISPRGSGYDADNETSIPMQLQACRDYARIHGGTVVAEYVDTFASGKDTDRPAFREMIAQLDDPNCPWDCILCYKLSRFSRSRRDCENLFYALTERGKSFASVTENIDINSISGRAYVGMLQIFNQLEREQTAEMIRQKMIHIARNGGCPHGKPPVGYKRSGKKHDNVLVPDPEVAPKIRRAFDMARDRVPIIDICRYLGTCTQSVIHILRNRTYIGEIVYAGQTYPGKHDPIIDRATFDAVQALHLRAEAETGHASRPSAQKFPYTLAGLVRCSCGRYMTPASAKSGKYHYYQCTDTVGCKARVSAEALQDAVFDVLAKVEYSETFLQGVVDGYNAQRRAALRNIDPRRAELRAELAAAEKKRENIIAAIASGMVYAENVHLFNVQLAELAKDAARIAEELKALDVQSEIASRDAGQEIAGFLDALRDMKTHLAAATSDPERLRSFARNHIRKISRLDDAKWEIVLNVTGESRFVYLQEWYTRLAVVELLRGFRFAIKIAS